MSHAFNLLFTTKRFTNKAEKSTEYLIEELSKQTNLMIWDKDGDIQDVLQSLPHQPHFILMNDYKPDYSPYINGLPSTSIPYGCLMHDLQYRKSARAKYIEKQNIKYIFTIYREASLKYFPQFRNRMIWFPHHVPLNVYKDYSLTKDINWLMAGALFDHIYPERAAMYEKMKKEPGFVYLPHPGYKDIRSKSAFLLGEDFARAINRSKMMITCDSIEGFPVLKYYEALACNTLLLATPSKELEDLGFIDGKTFAAVNSSNILEKAYYYLNHEEERTKMAHNGYELVREKHSTERRSKELVTFLQDIIQGRRVGTLADY